MSSAVSSASDALDVDLLLEAVYHRFHYDFRGYAKASLERRLGIAQENLGCFSIAALKEKILAEPAAFSRVLQVLSVQVSDMFRTPSFYRTFRDHVVPVLRTYPSIRIWVAGCCSGEEVVSFAILLSEEGLLDRSTIYATDINAEALRRVEAGSYPLDRIPTFSENYRLSGGTGPLGRYFTAADGVATFDPTLLKRVVVADHDLATDSAFAEMQVISCRNVLMYFDDQLRERVVRIFEDSLCRRGFLGIGSKETLLLSPRASGFHEMSPHERWYQRKTA